MDKLGINGPTIDMYLEMQLYAIGFFILNIYVWFESLPNALSELAFCSDR